MAGSTSSTIPTLPSTFSVHDFHSYGFHGTGIIPGLHFHLAASINAETGNLCLIIKKIFILNYNFNVF